MYLLIETHEGNYGYDYSEIIECVTFDDLVEAWNNTPQDRIEGMYEVTRRVSDEELIEERNKRAREKMRRRASAMEAARAVLTSEQLSDLGLN